MVKASNAAVSAEKIHEKVVEKRRALGRGLESLLPSRAMPAAMPRREDTETLKPREGPHPGEPKLGSPDTSNEATMGADTNPPRQDLDGARHIGAIDAAARLGEVAVSASVLTSLPAEAVTTIGELQASEEVGTPGLRGATDTGGRAGVPVAPNPAPGGGLERPHQAAGTTAQAAGEDVVWLALAAIEENPHQTRRSFKEEALKELAASIRAQGILQPVVVRPSGEDGYKLILGERRLRASQMAGLEKIPAIVKRVSEQQAAEMTLVENLQRQDLNSVEQAEAFSNLSQNFGLTQEQIGKRVGMSRETVANYMRLLSLPSGVLEALIGGRLTFSHAKALMPLRDDVQIWSFAKRAMEENLTVADLENLVRGMIVPHTPPQSAPRGARWIDPNVKAAQRSLEEVLGMRVRIRDQRGRGKIVIEYGTIDDFDRVVGMLRGGQ